MDGTISRRMALLQKCLIGHLDKNALETLSLVSIHLNGENEIISIPFTDIFKAI